MGEQQLPYSSVTEPHAAPDPSPGRLNDLALAPLAWRTGKECTIQKLYIWMWLLLQEER
jgi:hypothetical protein